LPRLVEKPENTAGISTGLAQPAFISSGFRDDGMWMNQY
jgi:hypothetical protein